MRFKYCIKWALIMHIILSAELIVEGQDHGIDEPKSRPV